LKIIYRYVTREYLRVLIFALLTFTAIYFIVDFFERFDMFIKHKAPFDVIVKYFFFKVPFIIYQMIPIAVLLATLLTMGILSKNNEITAMKSGGVSIYKVSVPLVLIALLITALTFWSSEYVMPYTNMKVTDIKNSVKKKKQQSFLKHDKIWYSGKGMIYNIDYFDGKMNTLNGVTIFYFGDGVNLKKRVDAKTGEYVHGAWILMDGSVREFEDVDGIMMTSKLKEFSEMEVKLPESPKTLKEIHKKADEMSYNDLKRFVAKIRSEGYSATEYEVDMHAKLALPFVSVIMTIIGIPFALKRERTGSLAVGIGISIAIGFFYWITLSFALSLGHAGVLPPVIAAWISLFIFLLIGAYMFSTIRQ
jgi:lipopolysaccharide export system permease protein